MKKKEVKYSEYKITSFTSNYPAFNLDGWNFIDQFHWGLLTCILQIKAKHDILSFIRKKKMIFIYFYTEDVFKTFLQISHMITTLR